jgi:hypothetical protein
MKSRSLIAESRHPLGHVGLALGGPDEQRLGNERHLLRVASIDARIRLSSHVKKARRPTWRKKYASILERKKCAERSIFKITHNTRAVSADTPRASACVHVARAYQARIGLGGRLALGFQGQLRPESPEILQWHANDQCKMAGLRRGDRRRCRGLFAP